MTEADNVSVEKNSNDEFRIKDLGISTAKFADGSVTGPKMATVNIVVSSSSGNYNSNDTTSSWNTVTNLSCSITTAGRPVWLMLISDGSGNATKIEGYSGTANYLRILRSGTEVYQNEIQGSGSGTFTYETGEVCLMHIDSSLSVGSYTYTVQVKSANNANVWVKYFKLVAFEM